MSVAAKCGIRAGAFFAIFGRKRGWRTGRLFSRSCFGTGHVGRDSRWANDLPSRSVFDVIRNTAGYAFSVGRRIVTCEALE